MQKKKRREGLDEILARSFKQSQVTGASDFFVPAAKMAVLVRYILGRTAHPAVSLNRPQVGRRRYVHRVEWCGVTFRSVSTRPLAVL